MADVNRPRDASAKAIVDALNQLTGAFEGMQRDVAQLGGEVAGIRRIPAGPSEPVGGARQPKLYAERGIQPIYSREDIQAATDINRLTTAGIQDELRRLEIIKAQTVERRAQADMERSTGGVYLPGAYRAGGGGAAEAQAFSQASGQRRARAALFPETGAPGASLIIPPEVQAADERRLRTAQQIADARRLEARSLAGLLGELVEAQELERGRAAAAAEAARAADREGIRRGSLLAMTRDPSIMSAQEGQQARWDMAGGPSRLRQYPTSFGPTGAPASVLPVSYVNQGPAFQQRANFLEWDAQGSIARAPGELDAMTSRMTRLGIVQNEASQAMRRHGALTTEFLSGLARGEVTLQEFGFHLGATAAKFGGWTAAAAGVYGVLGAAKELVSGLQESASGTATLSRFFEGTQHPFNAGAAQQGFRDVSSQLNVPISDVSNTQAAFARVFKDQNDSLQAARTSLTAYKLDNISAADSQRYFTAIVQEFGLSAKDLPTVLDQVSAAQRRMGARVQETLPAIARSAAAVRNAGGDINQLIALAATAQVSSGQTGNVVGTAFSRSAANFSRNPANQAIIRSLGVNPNQSYTQMLVDAVNQAQNLSGAQVTELARAIGGPQYGGRIFQSLLGQQGRLQQTLAQTSPEAAQGSAQQELQKQLQRVDEQIHQVTNNLQRLGSALGQTGAFLPLGVALKTLNLMLSTTTNLVEAFDHLPGPIRDALQYMLELRVALAFMRKTNIGAGIGEGLGISFLQPSAAETARRQAIIGTRTAESTAANRVESLTNQSQMLEAEAAGERALAQRLALQAEEETNLVAAANLRERSNAAIARAESAEARSVELEQAAVEQESLRVKLAEQRVALQKRELTAAEALNAEGEALVAADATRAGTTAARSGATALGGAGAGVETELAGAAMAGEAAAISTRGGRITAAIGERAAGLRTAATEIGGLGVRIGKGLGNFVGGLGLFGSAFAAFTVGEVIHDGIEKASSRIEQAQRNLNTLPQSAEAVRRLRDRASDQAKNGPQNSFWSRAVDTYTQHALGTALTPFGLGGVGDSISNRLFGPSQREIQTANDKAQANFEQSILDARKRTAGSNVSQNVGLSNREILDAANRDVTNIKNWGQTREEFNANFERYAKDLGVSIEALHTGKVDEKTKAALDAVRQRGLAEFGPTKTDPFAAFRGGLDQQLAYVGRLGDEGSIRGGTSGGLNQTIASSIFAVAKYGQSTDPKVIQKVLQAQQAVDSYISTLTTDLTNEIAAINDSESQRVTSGMTGAQVSSILGSQTQAISQAYAPTLKTLRDQKAHVYDNVSKVMKGYDDVSKKLAEARDLRDNATFGQRAEAFVSKGIPVDNASLDRYIRSLEQQKKAERKKVDDTSKAAARDAAKLQAAIDAAEQQRYDAQTGAINTRAAYQATTESDQSSAIVDQIDADREILKLAFQYHGPDKAVKVLEAMTKLNQDIASQAQQHLQDIQLQGDVRTSQIQTLGPAGDRARLQSQIDTARRGLAAAHAEANYPGKKDDILNAEKGLNDLYFQMAQQQQQDAANAHDLARQLYDSQQAIRMAGITDPLKQDRMTLQTDKHDLGLIRRSDYKTSIEYQIARNNQLAKVRGDQSKLQQDSIQSDYETAQFEHNIGQMSDDAYIAQLRAIVHMKGITKQMKRQLLTEIYNLTNQDAGSLDLNVGNIHLPTIYEVRRAVKAGQSVARNATISNSATFNIHVAKDADAALVGQQIEAAFGGGVTANLRAAGAL